MRVIDMENTIKVLAFSTMMFCMNIVYAAQWEYRVIFLAGTVAGSVTEPMQGGVIDIDKTATLNRLASEGWEVVSVTGASGADHAVYLRRAKISR